ncbi:hypothetical protein [Dapis sp. BLCC M172]|uniref:hypothetical protein n=1 Tax=Dapis sp. BLCC M172 TaxID=2975281 RepID=UPI003CF80E4B
MNLNHPFSLNISDLEDVNLDIEEQLTDEEAAEISGGYKGEATTMALGEEGGSVSTMALGEEGGYIPPDDIVCISAPCPGSETGGHPLPEPPKPPKPPQPPQPPIITRASFENVGGPYTEALHENGGPIYC